MTTRVFTILPSAALTLVLMALGPCVQGSGADHEPLLGRAVRTAPTLAVRDEPPASLPPVAHPPPLAPPRPPPPPPVQGPLQVRADPLHSRIGPRQVEHMREVIQRSDRNQSDVFAKMGGSSIASQAFLHCFASDDVVLGPYEDLSPTLAFFREGRAAHNSPFGRESVAAAVGWSLRQGLGGRPPRALREVQAIHPRYALAFFGGNDVQARNPRRFGERMIALVDMLEEQGVVPILGATLPRRDSRQMDAWSRRYNRISRAIAEAYGLPYIDFYQAFAGLPALGLARDGVHPNVHRGDHGYAPCQLEGEGLERGQNTRNLLTLQALDRVHRALDGDEGPLDPPVVSPRGAGSTEDPIWVERLPFAQLFSVDEAAPNQLEDYGGCWRARGDGPERVYRIVADAPIALEVTALGTDGAEAEAYLVNAEGDPASCVKGGRGDMWVEVPEGTWNLVVEVHPARRGRPLQGKVLFVVSPAI